MSKKPEKQWQFSPVEKRRLPESASSLPLRHWILFFLLGSVPLSAIVNQNTSARVLASAAIIAVAILYALLVNRNKTRPSKLGVVVPSFLGMLIYTAATPLLIDLIRGGTEVALILPMFSAFFLGVFVLVGAILAMSAIT